MQFSFEYQYLLWLLLLIPFIVAIYYYALYKKRQAFKAIGDKDLITELTKHHSTKAYFVKFLFILFALTAILLGIINVRWLQGSQKITKNGIDVMIAIDVSKSMLAQDVQPNRLERAKQVLNKLIDKLSNDRIGITIFAGKAYLQMPLTADHTAAKMYLASASTETIPTQGTVIADALKISNASFNANDKKYKAVVLISDGEDHDENALDIATEMGKNGVIINTIGIGSINGAQIIDEATQQPKLDNQGNIVVTKLNENILKQIAKNGNGMYQRYTNSEMVATSLYQSLSTLDKRVINDQSTNQYKSLFQILLGLAFLFLVLEIIISETKKLKQPKIKLSLAVIFIIISVPSLAQKNIIAQANKAYYNTEYNVAISKYAEVLNKKPTNYIALNNLGNALYKANKKDDALNAYGKAIENTTSNTEKSNTLYNKGVIQQNEKKLDECIKTYKQALILNPTNQDARHNLQLALQQQNKQKKEEEEQKNKDKKADPQPKPNKSNITPKDAAQKLEALLQNEKKLQDKMHKSNTNNNNNKTKDW